MRQVCKPKKKAILELKLNGQKPEQMHSVRQSNIIIKKKKKKERNTILVNEEVSMGMSLRSPQAREYSLQGSEQKSRCFSDLSNRLSVLYVLFHDSDHVIREFPFCFCFA